MEIIYIFGLLLFYVGLYWVFLIYYLLTLPIVQLAILVLIVSCILSIIKTAKQRRIDREEEIRHAPKCRLCSNPAIYLFDGHTYDYCSLRCLEIHGRKKKRPGRSPEREGI